MVVRNCFQSKRLKRLLQEVGHGPTQAFVNPPSAGSHVSPALQSDIERQLGLQVVAPKSSLKHVPGKGHPKSALHDWTQYPASPSAHVPEGQSAASEQGLPTSPGWINSHKYLPLNSPKGTPYTQENPSLSGQVPGSSAEGHVERQVPVLKSSDRAQKPAPGQGVFKLQFPVQYPTFV